MWFTYAILSSLFFIVSRTIQRYMLKGDKDFWAYSFWFSAIGALVNLPIVFIKPGSLEGLPTDWTWLAFLGIGAAITLHNFLNFSSSRHLPPSFKIAITKFRLIWSFGLGIIILAEVLTLNRALGVVFTMAAGLLVIGKLNQSKNLKGVLPLFLSTLIFSGLVTISSILLETIDPAAYTFLIFLFPAVLNFAIMPNAATRVIAILKQYRYLLLASTVLAAIGNLLMSYALGAGSQSDVVVIMEASAVALLGAEFFVLKEKGDIRLKIAAIILAIVGTLLVRLG
jgi:drug/metabolite transporter (DMT)-like permease